MKTAVFALLPWLLLLPLCCSETEISLIGDGDWCEIGGNERLEPGELFNITGGFGCLVTWVSTWPGKSEETYDGLKGFVYAITEKCLQDRTNMTLEQIDSETNIGELLQKNKAATQCALNTVVKSQCQPNPEHTMSYVCNYFATEGSKQFTDCLDSTKKCVARYSKAPNNLDHMMQSCKVDKNLTPKNFNCTFTEDKSVAIIDNTKEMAKRIVNSCRKNLSEWNDEEGHCVISTIYETCEQDKRNELMIYACNEITGYGNFCEQFGKKCSEEIEKSAPTTTIATTTEPTEAPTTDTTTEESSTSATEPLTSLTSTEGSNPEISLTDITSSSTWVEEANTTIAETMEASTTESGSPNSSTTTDPYIQIDRNPSTDTESSTSSDVTSTAAETPATVELPTYPDPMTDATSVSVSSSEVPITSPEEPSSTLSETPSSTSLETIPSSASTEAPIVSTSAETLTSSEISPTSPLAPETSPRGPPVFDPKPPAVPTITAEVDDGDDGGLKKQPRAETNQKPAEEEEGPNLVGLWVVLAIVAVVGVIVAIVVVVVLKRRQKKKKEQAEALKSNVSSKNNLGGELGLSRRPAAAPHGSTGVKGPARKLPAKKSPAVKEMKQMEAGVIDKGFKSLGPLTVDVAIRKGQKIAHATGDDDGREIDKVIFDHGLNDVVDIGSNIEKVSTEDLATVTVDRTDNTVEGPSRKGKSKERIEKIVVDTKAADKSTKRPDSSVKGK